MKRFTYVCADPGIPLPGTKGASIHVESVCCALGRLGWTGEVHGLRTEGDQIAGLPLRRMRAGLKRSTKDRERKRILEAGGIRLRAPAGTDFVYERYSLWSSVGLVHARKWDVPFIIEVNSPLPTEAHRYRSLRNVDLASGLARLLFEEADGIVCVSDEVAEWVRQTSRREDGVWVIPNGVDAERFAPCLVQNRRAPLPPPETPLVAFCGSFRPWHGTDLLLDAFEIVVRDLVPDAHLVCVGGGPGLEPFDARVGEKGLADRVHLTGQVPHHEVPTWLAGASVAVAPYSNETEFYFSPLKVFEFMAMGIPVVAVGIGQLQSVVAHGERGLLVEPGSSYEFAAAMAKVLTDSQLGRRLGSAGREWVLENATWEHRVRQMLDRVEGLL